ncbi:unnamed protein product, partial [Callosobruchus maculatus]
FFQKFKHLVFLEDTSIVQRESCCSVVECTEEDSQEPKSIPELPRSCSLEPEVPVLPTEPIQPLETDSTSSNVKNMKQTCQKSDGTKEKKIINAKEKIRLCSGNDFEEELKRTAMEGKHL